MIPIAGHRVRRRGSRSCVCGGNPTSLLAARGFSSAWNHDYPRAEQHLGSIVGELTNIDVRTDGSRILTLDDPELFRHPIAFMWEPGSGT
jgi:Cu/Zn superoxide dismutase